MDDYVIEEVVEKLWGSGEVPVWRVDYRRPNGTLYKQYIPKVALEWRMAEYGFGVEEALELLLYEPFMNNEPKTVEEDPAASVVGRISGLARGADKPIHLYNVPERGLATEAMRVRLNDAKTRLKVSSKKSQGRDPVDLMRETHGVTDTGIGQKANVVLGVRQSLGFDHHLPPALLPDSKKLKQPPMDDGLERKLAELSRE